jgi:hypothetical protein
MREAGHDVLIFDAPYNRHLDGPRANSWSEVVEFVLDYAKNFAK